MRAEIEDTCLSKTISSLDEFLLGLIKSFQAFIFPALTRDLISFSILMISSSLEMPFSIIQFLNLILQEIKYQLMVYYGIVENVLLKCIKRKKGEQIHQDKFSLRLPG